MLYIAFDLLYENGQDIRRLPFKERHRRLISLISNKHPRLIATELFSDGKSLWEWVNQNGWEGIVSKRLSSPYTEGKKHRDWLKKRVEVRIVAEVVGVQLKNGWVASLILRYEERYVGHVSGLDDASKRVLQQFILQHSGTSPFKLRKDWDDVVWLLAPIPCRVSALEFTDSGKLRQPKLIGFGNGQKYEK